MDQFPFILDALAGNLEGSTDNMRAVAAAIVQNLGGHEHNCTRIATMGGIEALVELLAYAMGLEPLTYPVRG